MPATASYTSHASEGQTVFRIEPARGSITSTVFFGILGLVCLFNALGAMSYAGGIFTLLFLALAALCLGRIAFFQAGRSTQMLTINGDVLKAGETSIKLADIAAVQAVDPSAGNAVLSNLNPTVMTDNYGRMDRSATMAVSGMQAAVGMGAAMAQRQAARNVRVEVRRHGASDRTTIALHLTADTAVALVADIGRVLQGHGVVGMAPLVPVEADGATAQTEAPKRPVVPPSNKVFADSPDGWRGLMAEAERRGWSTQSKMRGVCFVERSTGREVVASRIAEARQQLGI